MGEYYCWVNAERKEFLTPSDFGSGSKKYESMHKESKILYALNDLLAKEWNGCPLIFLGDQAQISKEMMNEPFRTLYQEAAKIGYENSAIDMVLENYKNISALYEESEAVVREEIGFFLEEFERGMTDEINEYGINPNAPFYGLFMRKGRKYIYTVNHSKKVAYSLESTKILYRDGEKSDYIDPLPILLGYGERMKPGDWLGDLIGVSDTLEEDIVLLDRILLDL